MTDRLSADELQQMQARCDKATDGPWAWDSRNHSWYLVSTSGAVCVLGFPGGMPMPSEENDAEFIAHARTDLPRLLAAYRALVQEQETMRGVIRNLLAADQWPLSETANYCWYCGVDVNGMDSPQPQPHEPDCAGVAADKLLAALPPTRETQP